MLVRGGVAMLPLAADQPGDHWPDRLTIHLGQTAEATGDVAWIEPAPPRVSRRWTDDPRNLLVRAIRPTDSTATGDSTNPEPHGAAAGGDAAGRPWLLLRMPDDSSGEMRLGAQRLQPHWLDPVEAEAADRGAEPFPMTPGPDLPDAHSPFEYWRWVLLAQRLGAPPPPRPPHLFDSLNRMVAEHGEALWRIGMQRLERAGHAAVAARCRELLTKLGTDDGRPLAAWIIDPIETAALLAILLDAGSPDAAVAQRALQWAETRSTLLLWPEATHGDTIRLAAISIASDPVVIRFTWRDERDVPIGVPLEPGVLSRITVDRPAPRRRGTGEQTLVAATGTESIPVVFGPPLVAARPPAVLIPALLPPLTLSEAWARARRPIEASRRTVAQVRRLGGRWEVFIECFRPGAPRPDHHLPQAPGLEHVAGIESISLILGPDPGLDPPTAGPHVVLTVPETGWHRLFRGENDGSLQIHRRSFGDRWNCRIVLPQDWIAGDDRGAMLFGLVRAHGDSPGLETFPAGALPWRIEPGRAAIDLTTWDQPSQSER
jgi:hypothetical protein